MADFGVHARDHGMAAIIKTVLSHQSPQGAFQTIGTDFRKLKYPFVWYDLLHGADVLCRLPFVRADVRVRAMVKAITAQADAQGRYTAGSMYLAWKGWSFADKKRPSPWLTFLALRVCQRIEQ